MACKRSLPFRAIPDGGSKKEASISSLVFAPFCSIRHFCATPGGRVRPCPTTSHGNGKFNELCWSGLGLHP